MCYFLKSGHIYYFLYNYVGGKMELALRLNCGFARVAVKEFSGIQRGLSRSSINHQKRKDEFQLLFADIEGYCDSHGDVEFWAICGNSGWTRCCDFVLDCFGKRWNPNQSVRVEYCQTFSVTNWKALPLSKQKEHTMTQCSACANEYFELQNKFPGLPCFESESIVTLNIPDASKVNDSTVTRNVMQELNSSFKSERNQSFKRLNGEALF